MNAKVLLILRILFGLFLVLFGSNKFLNFLPPFEGMSETAITYFESLTAAKVLLLVGIVETLAGISLLINKFSSLMMVILMSVSVNAVLFHLSLDIANIAPALVLLSLNIVLLYAHKERYRAMLLP